MHWVILKIDLLKAVKALTCDAEMRCALDEREIEFLWTAPGHIYGRHGWRENNGSKSERTAYPAGDFTLAVRHGGEGNARDVIERRKKWLNSITLGQRAVEHEEADAIAAGSPQGQHVPLRLPEIDEMRRKAPRSRPDSPSATAAGSVGGSTLLGPAHAFLSRHPMPPGQQVGLAPSIATPTLALTTTLALNPSLAVTVTLALTATVTVLVTMSVSASVALTLTRWASRRPWPLR